MSEKPQKAYRIELVRVRSAHVEHRFYERGVVERYVVLENADIRDLLDRPRRTQIASINLLEGAPTTSRSDNWSAAKRLAKQHLRKLYERLDSIRPPELSSEIVPKPVSRSRRLGREIVPLACTEEAAGQLLYSGMREDIPWCIELQTPDGKVYRIADIDLPRALHAAGASVGDYIQVRKVAKHRVGIKELRTGSHGTGKRTRSRTRAVYEVIKENSQVDSLRTQ